MSGVQVFWTGYYRLLRVIIITCVMNMLIIEGTFYEPFRVPTTTENPGKIPVVFLVMEI